MVEKAGGGRGSSAIDALNQAFMAGCGPNERVEPSKEISTAPAPEQQLRWAVREVVTRGMDLGIHPAEIHDTIMEEVRELRDDIARVDREGRA